MDDSGECSEPCILDLSAPDYDGQLASDRREKLITQKNSISKKMELYTVCTKGLLASLEEFAKKEDVYSLLDEVSKSGNFWTCLHYASHFG